jgi:hypothetical protein
MLHLSEDGQEVAQWHFVRRGVRFVIAMSAALVAAFSDVPLEVELIPRENLHDAPISTRVHCCVAGHTPFVTRAYAATWPKPLTN